jgi:hypothetical protein
MVKVRFNMAVLQKRAAQRMAVPCRERANGIVYGCDLAGNRRSDLAGLRAQRNSGSRRDFSKPAVFAKIAKARTAS